MNRYLLWSALFHLAVVLGGASLAPMAGFRDPAYRSFEVISVGLIDLAMPRLKPPAPAGSAEVALKPVPDLNKEEVPEAEALKPTTEEKSKDSKKKRGRGVDSDSLAAQQLAQGDTAASATGTIAEGAVEGDVWGVEVGPAVNPYHRRAFSAIRANWRNPAVGPVPRKCVVRFRVQRSGELTNIELESSSGFELFDRSALRAIRMTGSWEQFPKFWPEDEQIIHLEFEYRP